MKSQLTQMYFNKPPDSLFYSFEDLQTLVQKNATDVVND